MLQITLAVSHQSCAEDDEWWTLTAQPHPPKRRVPDAKHRRGCLLGDQTEISHDDIAPKVGVSPTRYETPHPIGCTSFDD